MYRNRKDKANLDMETLLMRGRLERSKMATSLLRGTIKGIATFFCALGTHVGIKTPASRWQAPCSGRTPIDGSFSVQSSVSHL